MNTFSTLPSVRSAWMPVIAVGLATFSVVTTEMLPVGLLTAIAGTLGISTGNAGLMISLPGNAGGLIRAVRRYCIGWSRSTLDTLWSAGVTGNSEPGFGAGNRSGYYAGSPNSCGFLYGRNMGDCQAG